MSGSHYAPPPHVTDDYGNGYDCRTLPEREADELAALRLEVQQTRDALAYLARRVDALEATTAAHRTAIEHTADAVQVIVLRGTP